MFEFSRSARKQVEVADGKGRGRWEFGVEVSKMRRILFNGRMLVSVEGGDCSKRSNCASWGPSETIKAQCNPSAKFLHKDPLCSFTNCSTPSSTNHLGCVRMNKHPGKGPADMPQKTQGKNMTKTTNPIPTCSHIYKPFNVRKSAPYIWEPHLPVHLLKGHVWLRSLF